MHVCGVCCREMLDHPRQGPDGTWFLSPPCCDGCPCGSDMAAAYAETAAYEATLAARGPRTPDPGAGA